MGRMWSNRTSALQTDCLTRQKPYKENRAYGPSVSNGTNGRLTSRRPLMWVVRVEDHSYWKIRVNTIMEDPSKDHDGRFE